MSYKTRFLAAAFGLTILTSFVSAAPVNPCSNLGIKVEIENPRLGQPVGRHYWGQALKLSLVPKGKFTVSEWLVDGPAIRDFDEQLSDGITVKANDWQEHPLPQKLVESTIRFYFLPSRQDETAVRRVRVNATVAGNTKPCKVESSFKFSHFRRPAEIYTSDHRVGSGPEEQHKGRVIDSHYVWHGMHRIGLKKSPHPYKSFLQWHHLFVDRYCKWRKLFEYPKLEAWWPGEKVNRRKDLYLRSYWPSERNKVTLNVSDELKFPNPQEAKNFKDFDEDVQDIHDLVHIQLQRCQPETEEGPAPFGCFVGMSSPKSELFWRFHLALTKKLYKPVCLCPQTPLAGCPDKDEY